MSYNIKKSDGITLLQLNDGQTDNVSSSITFIGRNYSNFGEIQNNNFLHLLENFADISPPQYPLTGQLWFDSNTTTNLLKVFNTQWQPLSILEYSNISIAATSKGNLWYNSRYNQLFINTGTGFTLIGPDTVQGYGTTRFVSASLKDTVNVSHPVIKCVIDDKVAYIISNDDFITSSTNLIPGISRVYKGITLKDGELANSAANVIGTSLYAKDASRLLAANSTSTYITASTSTTANTLVQRDSQGYITASGVQTPQVQTSLITATSGVLSGAWSVVNGLTPQRSGIVNLGTSLLKWNEVNATTVNTNAINFSTLLDQNSLGISSFDTDGTLTANSDTRLATQKAIKKYIDDKITAEVALRLSGDQTLKSQISARTVFPAGTILYTASATPPAGFFECNGDLKFKTSIPGRQGYPELWAALGSYYEVDTSRFRLPDLRGYFIRSWDNGKGIDAGRGLGDKPADVQADMNKTHSHGMPGDDQLGFASGYYGWTSRSRGGFSYDAKSQGGGAGQVWSTTDEGGAETRPKNIALMAIIKY
jgi:hypothetical protein